MMANFIGKNNIKPIFMVIGLLFTLFILFLLIFPLFQLYISHTIKDDQATIPLTLVSSIADAITVIGIASAPLSRAYISVLQWIQQLNQEITILISYTHQGLYWSKWIESLLQNNSKYTVYTENIESPPLFPQQSYIEKQKYTYTLSIVSSDYLQVKQRNEQIFHNWKISNLRKNGTGALLCVSSEVYQKLLDTKFDLRLVNFADPALTTAKAAEGRLQTAFSRRLKIKPVDDSSNASSGKSGPRYPGYLSAQSYLPERNQRFVGRKQQIQSIETLFEQGKKTVILTGLIGLGKTELAKEYAYRHQDQYAYVFWLDMSLPIKKEENLKEILAHLGLPENPSQQPEQIFQHWLTQQNEDEVLLVLDECQDPAKAKEFISKVKKGNVLITTSRNMGANEPAAQEIELGRMETEEAIELLLQLCGLPNNDKKQLEAARRVVIELDEIPEALEAASCYMKSKQCSLDTYLTVYKESRPKLIQKYNGQFHNQILKDKDEMIIVYTWWLYFEKWIQEPKAKKAEEILSYCAMLDTAAIPYTLIREVLLPGMKTSELMDEIGKLTKIFLVHNRDNTVSIDAHISKFFKDWLGPDKQKQLAISIISRISQFSRQKFTSYYVFSSDYRTQLDACAILIDKYKLTIPPVMNFCQMYGNALQTKLKLKKARFYLQKSFKLYEDKYPKHTPIIQNQSWSSPNTDEEKKLKLNFINSKIVEAEIFYTKGNYENAKNLLDERLLEAQEALLGEDHQEVATTRYQRIRLYYTLDNMKEFYDEQQKLSAIWKDVQRASLQNDELIELLKQEGSVAYMLKEYGTSKERYEEALELADKALALAKETRDQAGTMEPSIEEIQFSCEIAICKAQKMRCVVMLGQENAYEEAAESYRNARDMYIKYFNKEHPQVAQMYLNLAELYKKQGDGKGAKLLYERAEEIYIGISPTHPQIDHIKDAITNL